MRFFFFFFFFFSFFFFFFFFGFCFLLVFFSKFFKVFEDRLSYHLLENYGTLCIITKLGYGQTNRLKQAFGFKICLCFNGKILFPKTLYVDGTL